MRVKGSGFISPDAEPEGACIYIYIERERERAGEGVERERWRGSGRGREGALNAELQKQEFKVLGGQV